MASGRALTRGGPGLIRAAKEVSPKSLRDRCLAHKTRNVPEQIPGSVREEVKAMIRAAYYAPKRWFSAPESFQ